MSDKDFDMLFEEDEEEEQAAAVDDTFRSSVLTESLELEDSFNLDAKINAKIDAISLESNVDLNDGSSMDAKKIGLSRYESDDDI